MTQELFQMALNVTDPWFVKDLQFDIDKKRLDIITAPIYNLKLDAGDFVHNQGGFFSKRVQAQKNPSRS